MPAFVAVGLFVCLLVRVCVCLLVCLFFTLVKVLIEIKDNYNLLLTLNYRTKFKKYIEDLKKHSKIITDSNTQQEEEIMALSKYQLVKWY